MAENVYQLVLNISQLTKQPIYSHLDNYSDNTRVLSDKRCISWWRSFSGHPDNLPYKLDDVMQGDLDEVIESLIYQYQADLSAAIVGAYPSNTYTKGIGSSPLPAPLTRANVSLPHHRTALPGVYCSISGPVYTALPRI